MKFITILFISMSSLASGQILTQYDSLNDLYGQDRYLFEKYHLYKKKGGLVTGMLSEISLIENTVLQQYAMIAFYNQAYGYSWVDHNELNKVINGVINNPIDTQIKELALTVSYEKENGLIGQKIQDISLVDASGNISRLDEIEKEYIVVDLWATWCKPCLVDMKEIPTLRERFENVEFYSISFDKDYERMAKYINKTGYDWPIVFAGENHPLWSYFEVRSFPKYYILDSERTIIKGLESDLEEEIERIISISAIE